MTGNYHMEEFLHAMSEKTPALKEVFAQILQVYRLTSIPNPGIDFHFLHYPPGHYHSPLPSRKEYAEVAERAHTFPETLPGIDLREREQFRLFARLAAWYKEMPFQEEPENGLRYYFNNTLFCYADAFWLYAFLREFRPKRIVEVGSGFSSAIIMDTNERFLGNTLKMTFIEPNPDRLYSLLSKSDNSCKLYQRIPGTF